MLATVQLIPPEPPLFHMVGLGELCPCCSQPEPCADCTNGAHAACGYCDAHCPCPKCDECGEPAGGESRYCDLCKPSVVAHRIAELRETAAEHGLGNMDHLAFGECGECVFDCECRR